MVSFTSFFLFYIKKNVFITYCRRQITVRHLSDWGGRMEVTCDPHEMDFICLSKG